MEEPRRIVVASQDPEVVAAVRDVGAARNWEMLHLGSVTELLRSLDDGEIVLVVMDEALPGDPDLSLINGRRAEPGRSGCRVIWTLGSTTSRARPGADGYVRKPIDPVMLESAISCQLLIRELSDSVAQAHDRDDLTGLLNRRAFRERFDEECRRCWRYQRPFSVILLGLDRLQSINSRFGDAAGDKLIVDAARLCVRELRDMDVVARWGGAEFALLLPETHLGHALLVGSRLRASLAGLSVGRSDEVAAVTVSVGVAGLGEDDTTGIECLMRNAEEALRHAKENGRNGVTFHTPSGCVRFAGVGV
ncbi:MAG: GGDEF domain-containing protein [Planctomycetota bacterium]